LPPTGAASGGPTKLGGRVQPLELEVVLEESGKSGGCSTKPDASGREIDSGPLMVFGERRVRLAAAKGAEFLQLLEWLAAEEVPDGMHDGGGMGFDGDPVVGLHHAAQVKSRHHCGERRAGGLVAANLPCHMRGRDRVRLERNKKRTTTTTTTATTITTISKEEFDSTSQHLEAVPRLPHIIGVVDCPGAEPDNLFLELLEHREVLNPGCG